MDIRLERYRPELEEQWDQFVNTQAKNATFLHTRKFYNHNPANELDDASLVFLKKEKIVALFPGVIYERDGKRVFNSHLRSTYGGILTAFDTTIADMVEVMDLFMDFIREEKIDIATVRPGFRIYNRHLSDEVDYMLWKYGFTVKSRELELAIDLGHDIISQYNDSTHRSIKKSLKQGVVVNEDGDIAAYWDVLTENLKEKHGAKPVHTLDEINVLMDCVGKEKVKLFTAELDGKVIGGILCFITNPLVIHAQYIAADFAFQDYRPVNAVIDHIAHWSKKEGYKYFNLGMATEPGGTEINAGLFRFKEGFGARSVLRETMQLIVNN